MRTNEERAAAVRQRVTQIKQQKRRQRQRITALMATAACLAIIVGVSFAMPALSEKLAGGYTAGYQAAAGIFGSSAAAGYIAVGVLAFALGVAVTILCFRFRNLQEQDEEDQHD